MADTNEGVPRHRSPSYPYIDLESALAKAQSLYDRNKLFGVPVTAAIRDIGFSKNTSDAHRTLAGMQSYGLLTSTGSGDSRKVRLTDLAKRILLDKRERSADREKAIQEAALTPTIIKALWEEYGGSLPPDSEIEYSLVNRHNFNLRAVKPFIKVLRDTISFAKLEDGTHIEEKPETDTDDGLTQVVHSGGVNQKPYAQTLDLMQQTTFRLTGGKFGSLNLPRELNSVDISLLKKQVELLEIAVTTLTEDRKDKHQDE